MKDSIKKADILIEAIPYIKAFKNKIIVIKYGGSAIDDTASRQSLFKDIIFMNAVGIKPVLVHGGGPLISQRLRKLGRSVRFIGGRRVTDEYTIKVADGVLAKINRKLVGEITNLGGQARQLLAKKNSLILTKPQSRDLGFVGEPVYVNARFINRVLKKGIIPVISSVAAGRGDNKLYNVNADQAAAAVAAALKAEKFVLFTNVDGILKDESKPGSLLSSLSAKKAREFIKNGVICEGMIPKVLACIRALKAGVKKAHIIGAYVPHSLLLEIFTKKGVGTEIVNMR